MGQLKNLSKFFPWALVIILMIHFPLSCKGSECLDCYDFDQSIGLKSNLNHSCENPTGVRTDYNCTTNQCYQYKVIEKEKNQILIFIDGCARPEPCQTELKFGKEKGCKSVSGKEYKGKCQGLGIPASVMMELGAGGGGGMKEMKDDWTVEYCVCSGDFCNNKIMSPPKNEGNCLNGLDVTGNGLVMMIMMTVATALKC